MLDHERFQIWPIDRPRPNPHNARVHPPEQIEQLIASLKTFGMTRPILVDEHDVILAGHGILIAALQAGLQQVRVVIVDQFSSEEQKRAYLLADNQLAQNSHWGPEKLRAEVEHLEKQLFDMAVVGFSPEELDRIFADLAPERLPVDEDDTPPIPKTPVTVLGDVWILGRHRLLCGDSLLSPTLDRVLAGRLADTVFSDLPYGVGYQQPGRNRTGLRQIANDNLGPQFGQFLTQACVELLRVTQGALYLCMSSSEIHTLHQAFTAAGGHWSTFIIWAKDQFTLGRSDYQRQYEPILYGWPAGQHRYWCGSRRQGDVWQIPRPQISRLHPTMKPVALVERAIRNSCRRGGVVLDAFAGAGATLIACEKAGRQARLVELEPRFVDVMVQRWEAYTGQEATWEPNGQSFKEVMQERQSRVA